MASIRTASTTEHLGRKNTSYELDNYGIKEPARVYWNLNTPELYEEIARRNEGVFSNYGAILVDTGEINLAHLVGISKQPACPIGQDGAFRNAAPKCVADLHELLGAIVPFIMLHLLEAESAVFSSEMPGDDVPADSPLGEIVQGREGAYGGVWVRG